MTGVYVTAAAELVAAGTSIYVATRPKPKVPAAPLMPSQPQVDQQQTLAEAQAAAARNGRAATVLSQNPTSDQLGP